MTKLDNNHSAAKIVFRVIFAIMALAVMAYIFVLSSETAAQSSKTSSGIIEKIADTFVPSYKSMTTAEKTEFVASLQDIVRKWAHVVIFGALGISVAGFVSTFRGNFWLKLIFCQVFCSAYAAGDEFHQKFSAGRSFQYTDIAADSLGALIGILIVLLIALIFWRNKSPKMKKKALLKHVEALTEKLMEADECIKELNDTLTDKDKEISQLNGKIEKMATAERENIKINEPAEVTEEFETVTAQNAAEEKSAPTFDYSDFAIDETNETVIGEDIKNYAVKVISNIITESVKIGCVLASSGSENKKELLNLALGRTEVAKNEISTLVSSDLPDELKKASIDKEAAEVTEYYQSILAQI